MMQGPASLASLLARPQLDGTGLLQRLSHAPARGARMRWALHQAGAVAEPRLGGRSQAGPSTGLGPLPTGPARWEKEGGGNGSAAGSKQAVGQSRPDGLPEAAHAELTKLEELGPAPRLEDAALLLKRLAELLRGAPSSQLVAVRRHPTLAATLAALAAGLADPAGVCPAPAGPSQLPGLLQSCAYLQLKAPRPVLEAFGCHLAEVAPELAPAEAVRSAWALSRLGWCAPRLLAAIEREALGGSWLQALDVDGLVSLLWVCNRASFSSTPLLGAVVEGLFHRPGATGHMTGATPGERRGRGRDGGSGSGGGTDVRRGGVQGLAAAAAAGDGSGGAHMSGRAVSLALYSCGALLYKPPKEQLQALCSAAARALPELTHQGVANIVWSLGRLSHHDPKLMDLLAAEALKDLSPYNAHELALVASGYAGVGHIHRDLLVGIATELAGRGSWHNAMRDLSHVLSSMAKQHARPGANVLAALEKQVVRALRMLDHAQGQQTQQRGKQQGAGPGGEEGGNGVGAEGASPSPKVKEQQPRKQPAAAFPNTELCWVLWAFARLTHRPKALLRAVDEAWGRAPVRVYELGPEDAGRALWALARLEHKSGAVLGELALALRRLLPRMPPQSMAMALHGYATLGFAPHELLDGAAEHMAARLGEYPPQSVAGAVWAFARLGVHPGRGLPGGGVQTEAGKPLLVAVEDYAIEHAGELSPQPIAMLCWGLATLHHHPTYEFLDTVAARLAQPGLEHDRAGAGRHAATLHALSLVAWAFAQWGHKEPRLLQAVCHHLALVEKELASRGEQQQEQLGEGQQGQQEGWAGGGGGEGSQQGVGTGVEAGPELEWWEEAAGAGAQGYIARGGVDGGAMVGVGAGLAPATVSNLAFALAKQQEKEVELVHSLRRMAERNLDRYNAQELVNLLWCHAALGVQPPTPFLEAACTALGPLLPSCDASLAALAVHSVATLRYIPPDDWMEAAVCCVAEAVHDRLEEREEGGGQEQQGDGNEEHEERGAEAQAGASQASAAGGDTGEEGATASAAGEGLQAAAPAAVQQADEQQQEHPPSVKVGTAAAAAATGRGARAALRKPGGGEKGSRQGRRRRAPGVHVTLVAKLLWGCAHVGYIPPGELLQPLTDSAQWALSHSRARGTVLHAAELVRLLWALAVLEQYHTALYRNLCFRTSRLPPEVPRHPVSIQLLHQVAMLSSCEARFTSLPLRGNHILPEWLREGGTLAPVGPGGARGRAAAQPVPAAAAAAAAAGIATTSVDEQAEAQRAQRDSGHAAAEALAAALRSAGCRPAALRQLLFGDWVVLFRFRDSGQAAVLPWLPSLRAVNAPARVLGSAVATSRVLASKGFPVVVAGEEQEATVAECLDLWT